MSAALSGQIIIAVVAGAGSVLGYLLAGLNDARRDRRVAAQERRKRVEDRYEAAYAAQRARQLENVLALQDAVQQMGRLHARSMLFDYQQAKAGQHAELPPDLDQELYANEVEVQRLRGRLLDDSLREKVEQFANETAREGVMFSQRLSGLRGEELYVAGTEAQFAFAAKVTTVMDQLGAAVRTELAWLPHSD